MAYNNPYQVNYNPQLYTPYVPQYQPVFTPPAQQQQQAQPSTSNVIWVEGEAAAKSYLVGPNQTVALWDNETQTIYLKSADAAGLPSYKVLEYTIKDTALQQAETPKANYVTKEDFDEFASNIQRQLSKLINKNNRKFEEE